MTQASTVPAPAFLKSCCADLWRHPGIRLLAGDSLHPGGGALTGRVLDLLALPPGSRLLDVGSGPGATRDLAAARGLRPVGTDISPGWRGEARAGSFAAADAERLPFRDGAFDGAVAECVLSLVPDRGAALRELRRVLASGGRLAVADVTREGKLPEELQSVIGWVACAAGATSPESWNRGLSEAGFEVLASEAVDESLGDMVAQARRRLALVQGAVGAGLVDPALLGLAPGVLDLGQRLLEMAADLVQEGGLGYALILARA